MTLARVSGAPIRAHTSLILVFFVFVAPAFMLGRTERVGASRGELVLWSLAAALLFVLTILLHELGHVYQARREGMEVHGVTLWALGGVASLSGGNPSPGQEFRVAAAGPAITASLALLLIGLPSLAGGFGSGLSGPVLNITGSVGRAQLYLLAFNLIPAFPLDGGRILLAALWRLRGNLTSAIRIVAASAKVVAGFLIALSVVGFLSPRLALSLPAALRIDGLAGLFIGLLIYDANRHPGNLIPAASAGAARGGGPVVADFMNPEFVIAEPRMTIAALLEGLTRLQVRPLALVVEGGRPLGMISKLTAEGVQESRRESTRVEEVMVKKGEIRTLNAFDPLSAARAALEDGPETAVVLRDDVVVGLLSVSDLARGMVLGQKG